jgi:hypothetical protein
MAGTNFVGAVTIAANTAVGLFANSGANSGTPVAGVWALQGVLSEWGLCQVQGTSGPSTEVAYELPLDETFQTGGAEIYLYNPTGNSITFNARFASTS